MSNAHRECHPMHIVLAMWLIALALLTGTAGVAAVVTPLEEAARIADRWEADVHALPEQALAAVEPLLPQAWLLADGRLRNRLEWIRGTALTSLSNPKRLISITEDLQREATRMRDHNLHAVVAMLRSESGMLMHKGRTLREAQRAYDEAKLGADVFLRYEATLLLGAFETLYNNWTAARQHFEEALALAGNNRHRVSRALNYVAKLDIQRAPALALQRSQEAFSHGAAVGSLVDQCNAKWNEQRALGHLGQPAAVEEALVWMVAFGERHAYQGCEGNARRQRTDDLLEARDFHRALAAARELIQRGEHWGDTGVIAMAKRQAAVALTGLGKTAAAAELEREAAALNKDAQQNVVFTEYDQGRAEAELADLARENERKAAELEQQSLLQKVLGGLALALLAMLVLGGLLLQKRAIVARLKAAALVAERDHALEEARLKAAAVAAERDRDMAKARRKAEVAALERDRKVAQANLRRLEAQIKPHFLWNTLATLQQLVRQNPTRADTLLGHLITHLRATLSQSEELQSTLGREFSNAAADLEIIALRFGERLTVRVDLPPELAPFPFPTLIVQTLVENAVKHGIEPKMGPATITLRARTEPGHVMVTVTDDGVGLRPSKGMGIGMRNTRERLQTLYGDSARLTLGPNTPCGVVATTIVPSENTLQAAAKATA